MTNEEEPRNTEEEPGEPEEGLSQDPFVERVRPEPSEPPIQVRVLEGLLGESDRERYRRLYFSRELDNYAEFRHEDVVFREPIPSEQAPLVGLEATRVGIRRDAPIEYTRVKAPRPVDEFDLDVRLGGPTTRARRRPIGDGSLIQICCTNDPGTGCLLTQGEATCGGFTCDGTCGGFTCGGTCEGTCGGFTCEGTCGGENTCFGFTCGGENTCFGFTCGGTCDGTCGGFTCGGTCDGTCGQFTCEGTCGGFTCEGTCGGENTCFGFTCGGENTCFGFTCGGENTCFGFTCEGTCGVELTCPPPCFLKR